MRWIRGVLAAAALAAACVLPASGRVATFDLGSAYLGGAGVVTVPCGTYGAQTITGQNPGAVTFRAASPHCVTIGGLTLGANNGSTSGMAPSNLTLDGIDVNGTVFGWYSDNSGQTPGPNDFVLENSHVWDTSDAGGAGIYLYSFRNALIQDVEVGPVCCNADGIDMAIPRPGAPSPYGITLNRVNVHDVYDSCAIMAASLPGTPCSGAGFESGCSSCAHVDGTQWYGGNESTIENSSFTRINPGGAAAQGIFWQSANGGVFSSPTIVNNTLGSTANNDLSISGPGNGVVTGTTTISGNHVAGNIRLYGDGSDTPFAAGVRIVVSGNVASEMATTLGNGCSLTLQGGQTYLPEYSGNTFANGQCQGSGQPPPPPPPPPPVTVIGLTATTVSVKWTSVKGTTGYQLYYDGVKVSTAGGRATTAKFAIGTGQHLIRVQALPASLGADQTLTVSS